MYDHVERYDARLLTRMACSIAYTIAEVLAHGTLVGHVSAADRMV